MLQVILLLNEDPVHFHLSYNTPTKPDGEWHIRAENISYFTDICEAKELDPLFWGTGVQRNADLAHELIFLGDGAEWIWNLVDRNFPLTVQIIDWFHACEYLMPVAKMVFKDKNQQKAWVKNVKESLWWGELGDVIAACQAHINPYRREYKKAH